METEINTISIDAILSIYKDGYTQIHNVDGEGNILAGKPLGRKQARSLFTNLYEETKEEFRPLESDGILPSDLVYFDAKRNQVCWLKKAHTRRLIFKTHQSEVCPTTTEYPVPNILFNVKGRSVNIHAVKVTNVKNTTKLFKAPFWNTSEDGSVCMGSASIKGDYDTIQELIEETEYKFFESTFTHPYNSRNTKTDYVKLMKSLEGKSKFPTTELIPTKLKIENILY